MKRWSVCWVVMLAFLLIGCATTVPNPPKFLESRIVPLPFFTVKLDIAPDAQALIDQEIGCFKVKLVWLNKDGTVDDTAEIEKKIPYEELIMQINGGMTAAHQFALIETRDIIMQITQCGHACDPDTLKLPTKGEKV